MKNRLFRALRSLGLDHYFGRRFGVLGAFAIFALAATSAEARDLHGRLGLGYNGQFPVQRDSGFSGKGIALKYALTKDFALEPVLGFATGAHSQNTFGLKLFKNVFYETNLNFYFFGDGAAMHANGDSSYAFQSGFGSEFFIPGLESIGISFEVGAELTNATFNGATSLRTVGFSFLDAGMRFYF